MTAITILRDALQRVEPDLKKGLDGLDTSALLWRPAPQANSLAWLAWHMGRCVDAQLSPITGKQQLYVTEGFADRFRLPFPVDATGYGMTSQQVGEMTAADPAVFLEYFHACAAVMDSWLGTITEADLLPVIDSDWTPPVTVGARIVSIINDDTQHVGQVGYVRGLWEDAQAARA